MNDCSGRSPGKMTTFTGRRCDWPLWPSCRSARAGFVGFLATANRQNRRAPSFELYELIARAAYLSSKPKLTRRQISAPL
jgi:hypothetical protein